MDFPRDGFKWDEEAYKKAREGAPARLPDPVSYEEFESHPVEKPRAIVQSLLDSSSRMVVGGGSKTYKTWAMCDLALSIAAGVPWWMFKCFMNAVLYVNFELKPYYARERFRAIRLAKGIQKAPANLFVWNLRDYNVSRDLNAFKEQTIETIGAKAISVIFLDPFYKLLGEADERISGELIPILNLFEDISRSTETSVVVAAHYTKGNQAAKDPLDRISGGAAINRHPDSLLLLTKHEEEGSFTIDTVTRDFVPINPFVVTWRHPLLCHDKALDPEALKKVPGAPKQFSASALLTFLCEHDDEFNSVELKKAFEQHSGCGRSTFFNLQKELLDKRKMFVSKITGKCCVQN